MSGEILSSGSSNPNFIKIIERLVKSSSEQSLGGKLSSTLHDLEKRLGTKEPELNTPFIPIELATTLVGEARQQARQSGLRATQAEARATQAEARVTAAEQSVTLAEVRARNAESQLSAARERVAAANARIQAANETIRRQNQAIADARLASAVARNETRDPLGYFRDLGLSPDAFAGLTEAQIKAKLQANYRVDSMRAHPDRGGNEEAMARINAANAALSNPAKRQAYINKTGEFGPRRRR